ncbi:MAG: hypothetical protein A2X94_02485 [Bdellovibrionales bacterium GWB1_55_8]|nr:MAG: hypothetical protein A2X94_02485 [Bdellovibrionales bacterium GWB1_55_8]
MADTHQLIKEVLTRYKKIAVVGLSSDANRPSFGVTRYLIEKGYDVVGVNPAEKTILERPCYESIDKVPAPLEIVDVFRNPKFVPDLVERLISLRPKVLWLQEGVGHPEAEKKARDAGIEVISNRCILKEHMRLIRD